MADIDFLPRRLDRAFSRLAFPEAAKALLVLHGNPEYVSWWDDFLGDGLDAKYAADVGAGTQVVGVTAALGGTMTLASQGNQAGDGAGQGFGLHWNGDRGLYFISRFKISDITNSKFEIGVTDATDDEGGAVDTKATPTFTATDCAVFVRDTTDDTNTTFVSNGGSIADANADATLAAVNDTYMIAEIVVQNDVASGFLNGQLVGSGGIEGGNALTPWAMVEQVGTASARTLTVDYWGIIGPRS